MDYKKQILSIVNKIHDEQMLKHVLNIINKIYIIQEKSKRES